MSKFNKLSRAEMRDVLGGNPPVGGCGTIDSDCGTCTVTVTCANKTTVSCTGSGGNCHQQDDNHFGTTGYVQCDKDAKVSC